MRRFDDLRVCAALCAATAGVLICVHQHHFQLSLTHLYTFRVMLRHRCGDTLAAGVLWATIEVVLWFGRELRQQRPLRIASA